MRVVRWTPEMQNWNIRPAARIPALDVLNHDDHVEVRMDLPGVDPENVNIEVKDEILTISAEVKSDETHETGNYTYRERYNGSYQRSLRVPETIDVQKAEARYENGVLILTLPKLPEAGPLRIPVKGVEVK